MAKLNNLICYVTIKKVYLFSNMYRKELYIVRVDDNDL